VAFPGTRQSFQFVEGLLRIGLSTRDGGECQQNNGQPKTKGFHVSFSLRRGLCFCVPEYPTLNQTKRVRKQKTDRQDAQLKLAGRN
jgi:hypothetical protein